MARFNNLYLILCDCRRYCYCIASIVVWLIYIKSSSSKSLLLDGGRGKNEDDGTSNSSVVADVCFMGGSLLVVLLVVVGVVVVVVVIPQRDNTDQNICFKSTYDENPQKAIKPILPAKC